LDRLRHRRQSPFELSASPDEPRPPKPSHPSQKQSPTTKTLLDATQSLLENERLWTGTSLSGRHGAPSALAEERRRLRQRNRLAEQEALHLGDRSEFFDDAHLPFGLDA